jgi:predicted RecB family endonuclease
VVVPNAAINQLACQSTLGELLASLRPRAEVLVQAACTPRPSNWRWRTGRRFAVEIRVFCQTVTCSTM